MEQDPTKPPVVRRDGQLFEASHSAVARRLLRAVSDELQRLGLTPDQHREATGHVVFRVLAILDGCEEILEGGRSHSPIVSFYDDSLEDDNIILPEFGVGTYMHEIIGEISDEEFADE